MQSRHGCGGRRKLWPWRSPVQILGLQPPSPRGVIRPACRDARAGSRLRGNATVEMRNFPRLRGGDSPRDGVAVRLRQRFRRTWPFPCPATAWCVVRTALTLCPGGKAGVVAVFGLTLDLNGPKDAPIFRASGWIAGRSGSTGVRFKDCFLELSRARVPDPASRPVRFEYQRSDRSVVVPRARRSGLSQPHLIQA